MNRHFILDTLMKAQAEVIGQTECWQCGTYVADDEIELRNVHDCGEVDCREICRTCIKRGFDTWGDPRT